MFTLKLIQIGNSIGVILPKEMLGRLNVKKGDAIYITEAVGGYRLTSHCAASEDQMKTARKIMRRRHAVLRTLAK